MINEELTTIKIIGCGNNKIKDDLLILILSIAKNVSSPVEFTFLTADFPTLHSEYISLKKENVDYFDSILKSKNPKSSFKTINISEMVQKDVLSSINKNSTYSPYSYLRLYMHRIPQLTGKYLYLDTDTIVAKDIKELYDTNISEYELAAVKDFYGSRWINPKYCNSGVLLLNLEEIRKTNLFENALKRVLKLRMFMPDQSAINHYCRKKLILNRKYNHQSPKMKEGIVIHHFSKKIFFFPIIRAKNIKPHEIDSVHKVYKIHEYDEIFNEYLKLKDKIK